MNRFTASDRWLIHLEDRNAEQRLKAIDEAYALGQSEVEGSLRHVALQDKNAEVRLAALQCLLRFHEDRTADTLRRALLDPDVDVRRLAAESLARYPDEESVLALVSRVNDAHPVAIASLQSLGKIATDSAFRQLCFRAELKGWPRQIEAIVALGDTRRPGAVPTLGRLLDAEWIPVRTAAVKALGRIGESTGYAGAGAILIETLMRSLDDEAADVRLCAIDSLQHTNAWESFPALNAALGDDSERVRAAAVAALTRLGAPTHSRMAVKALAYDMPRLRIGAVRRLEALADRSTCFALEASQGDSDPEVRSAAAVALRRLCWEVQPADFHEALDSEIASLRAGAIRRLAERGDLAFAPRLIKSLEDSDINVRIAAARALGNLDIADACPVLCDLLADPALKLREAAIVSLGKLGCRRAIPALHERYKTFGGEPDVRLRKLLRAAIHATEERTEQHAHLPIAAFPPDLEDDDLPISASFPPPPDGR